MQAAWIMRELIHIADDIDKDTRMSDYLKGRLKFSSALITRVKYGGVRLNGEVVTMRATVKLGDTVTVSFPDEESGGIEPADIALDIVYEDEDILAVNKPENMPTHPSRGNHLPTLANAVMGYFDGRFVFRAITRLDRDTSGLVIIAKNPLSAARLCDAMRRGEIKKQYTALVSGAPESPGVIDAPIRREAEGSIKRCVAPDGKPALTKYEVIKVTDDGNSLCSVVPITGRTHQIRVHFAHIGHPLVRDFLYGERGSEGSYKLACTSLELKHPSSGEILKLGIKAPF